MATTEVAVTAEQARSLTDRIKVAVDGTWLLIQEAYTTRAWAVLGYGSWDDYCTREFGTSRLRLPREERQEVVASLREIGMSVRAIAAATGQGYGTVRREIAGEPNGSPVFRPPVRPDLAAVQPKRDVDPADAVNDGMTARRRDGATRPNQAPSRPIIGTDGKQYSPTPRTAVTPQRPALPPQFQAAAGELSRVIARIERLQGDDRYRANRASIATACLPEIRRAAEVLAGFLADLGHDSGGPPL